MSQFQRLCFGLSLLVVAHSDGVQSNGPNACPHPALVTYSRQVYKSKLVPYQQHTFWRGWQTKYRTQYGWENEVSGDPGSGLPVTLITNTNVVGRGTLIPINKIHDTKLEKYYFQNTHSPHSLQGLLSFCIHFLFFVLRK